MLLLYTPYVLGCAFNDITFKKKKKKKNSSIGVTILPLDGYNFFHPANLLFVPSKTSFDVDVAL
jgi:hypothetical protein